MEALVESADGFEGVAAAEEEAARRDASRPGDPFPEADAEAPDRTGVVLDADERSAADNRFRAEGAESVAEDLRGNPGVGVDEDEEATARRRRACVAGAE